MRTIKYVYWQDGDAWLGYLQDYPDYCTQGETLDDLIEHLRRRLFVEASITARPFFEAHGFAPIEQQTVTVRGVAFVNYRMERTFA